MPWSINGYGVIAGSYYTPLRTHGFLRYPDGTITSFDPPGATESVPESINDSGEIIGSYFTSDIHDHSAGFLRDYDGTFYILEFPGATFTSPVIINPSGAVAGSYIDRGGVHGFVFQ